MSGPVLAFAAKGRRSARSTRAVQQYARLAVLDPENAAILAPVIDGLLSRALDRRAGNIGKPVVDLDYDDDRDGA